MALRTWRGLSPLSSLQIRLPSKWCRALARGTEWRLLSDATKVASWPRSYDDSLVNVRKALGAAALAAEVRTAARSTARPQSTTHWLRHAEACATRAEGGDGRGRHATVGAGGVERAAPTSSHLLTDPNPPPSFRAFCGQLWPQHSAAFTTPGHLRDIRHGESIPAAVSAVDNDAAEPHVARAPTRALASARQSMVFFRAKQVCGLA